jgi:hypothetical protein
MAFLNDRDRAAVRQEFEKLAGPVKLVVFSQELVAGGCAVRTSSSCGRSPS